MDLPAAADPVDIDRLLHDLVFDPALGVDPHPTYDWLREHAPVHRCGGYVALTRYQDCYSVLRDPRLGKAPVNLRDLFTERPGGPESLPDLVSSGSMVFLDPPEHTRVRGFVHRAFTPKRVAALRPHVTALADRLLDEVADHGGGDLVEEVAFRMPIDVIGELVGVPSDEREQVRGLVADAVALIDPMTPNADVGEAAEAAHRLGSYFSSLVRRVRRDDPTVAGDHLVRALVDQQAATPRAERLRPTELVATLTLLYGAGFESTAYLISTALASLVARPDLVADLRADGGWDTATEEALRYHSVFQLTARIVRTPLEVGGTPLAAGDWVVPFLGAANRDPDTFADPARFDPWRRPNHHVAFSSGVHHCLGAALARLEIEVVLERTFSRFDVALDPDEPAPWWRSFPFRAIDRLPVLLEPRAAP